MIIDAILSNRLASPFYAGCFGTPIRFSTLIRRPSTTTPRDSLVTDLHSRFRTAILGRTLRSQLAADPASDPQDHTGDNLGLLESLELPIPWTAQW